MPNDTKDKAGTIGSVVSPAPANSPRSSTAVIDKKHDELRLLINSRNPIITVETTEEDRFEELLQTLSTELGVPLFTWTVTSGLAKWNVITGVQGCGKSLVARAVAGEWGIELVRLDAGSLYDKFVGESEKRLHRALDLAEKLSPVVLWIDEIEKAFASAGSSGDADAGLSQRLLATLLTWMQDRQSLVFLAATSNNIKALPPEMLRKGRFDEIFFVDLPNAEIRAQLFTLHLKKRGRDAAAFDVPKLATAAEGFSGAEIEQAIVAGLYTAFSQKQQLSTEIVLAEIQATQPLSVTRMEDIQSIREWAKSRTVPAD